LVAGEVKGLPAQAQRFAGLYAGAAERYKLGRRGPAILASIHQTESEFGANMGPSSAGAIGQMQFMPKTWSDYGVDANGDGEMDPSDAEDAIYGAANYLRASGAPEDWYRAIFAYNRADWYVQEILEGAEAFGDVGEAADAITVACEGEAVAGGPAELDRAIRVYEPARDQRVPARHIAPGFGPIVIDARIWPDVRWVLETYDLVLTAGKETGHASHGDGSAIDAVPAESIGSIRRWRETAERLARDLGWRPECAASGVRPACDLVPAIEFIGYNGYDASHGDPAHSSIAHIHVSWVSETHGTPHLTTPEWMLVFPVPTASPAAPTSSRSSGPQVSAISRPGGRAPNEAIEGLARSASKVQLVDWRAIARRHGLPASDRIHASLAGYRRRAEAEIAGMVAS
ncbi:MAG: lytic murein transglycosylase, partial [Solirubrobacterales bacterium]